MGGVASHEAPLLMSPSNCRLNIRLGIKLETGKHRSWNLEFHPIFFRSAQKLLLFLLFSTTTVTSSSIE
jgi:hypothetical protein